VEDGKKFDAKEFCDALIANGKLEAPDARRVLRLVEKDGSSIRKSLLSLGLVAEDILLEVLAQFLGLRFFSEVSSFDVEEKQLERLGFDYCNAQRVVPVKDEEGKTVLLLAHPENEALRMELVFFLGASIEVAVVPERSVRHLLEVEQVDADDALDGASEEQSEADLRALQQDELEGPVIKFVSKILEEAVIKEASDIHFESQESGLRIRFRMHGVLVSQKVDGRLNESSILARVKVMSSMNVSERRLPQDGRISVALGGRNIDFRVSSVPTSFGESIVCRVLDPNALRLGWDALGFERQTTDAIQEIIERPSGLFLVTGPTGSGKTTTLYTALSHLNQERRKILTVEDPIEYNLAGIEQVQVHEEVGMTFAKALRAFLRQDPNVIMVGEIRDEETAEIACRAAMVGRMVLSTMHTNEPEGALPRLVDLGVPEYLARGVLRGALGQQLVLKGHSRRSLEARLVTFD